MVQGSHKLESMENATMVMRDRASVAPPPFPVHFLVTTLDRGGAEKILTRWAAGLPRAKYAVQIATLQGWSQAVVGELERARIPALDLGMVGWGDPRVLLRLPRVLRRERIRIPVTFLFHATLLGRVGRRLARVPVRVSSERTLGGDGWRWRLLNRRTVPLATHVVAVSERVAAHAPQAFSVPPERLTAIVNGVDPDRFQPVPRLLDPVVLTVGSTAGLHLENDHATLLTAFAPILARRPHARLILVGRGPQENSLRKLAARLGTIHSVTFAGERADVRPWLARIHVFVHTSLTAGISHSIVDAMAAGLPVVATAVGGAPEDVVDGGSGLLVRPRDPAALADAMERVFGDSDMRDAFGRAVRARGGLFQRGDDAPAGRGAPGSTAGKGNGPAFRFRQGLGGVSLIPKGRRSAVRKRFHKTDD